MFHLSHFHRLVSGLLVWVWLLGRFVCFAFAFFLSSDQSVRSSYQPMTSLAYLHDCHCRYDERSVVQKKNAFIFIPNPNNAGIDLNDPDFSQPFFPGQRLLGQIPKSQAHGTIVDVSEIHLTS